MVKILNMNDTDDAPPKFEVGDGVHIALNGDRYPFTVRRVNKSGKRVWVSRDSYKILSGSYYEEGPKECEFTPQDVPEEKWEEFRLTKTGEWVPKGTHARRGYYSGFKLYPERQYSRNPHV